MKSSMIIGNRTLGHVHVAVHRKRCGGCCVVGAVRVIHVSWLRVSETSLRMYTPVRQRAPSGSIGHAKSSIRWNPGNASSTCLTLSAYTSSSLASVLSAPPVTTKVGTFPSSFALAMATRRTLGSSARGPSCAYSSGVRNLHPEERDIVTCSFTRIPSCQHVSRTPPDRCCHRRLRAHGAWRTANRRTASEET